MSDSNQLEFPPEVVKALHAGRKIEAIKLLRAATGLDLKAAKELVDQEGHHYKTAGNTNSFCSRERNAGKHLFAVIIIVLFIAGYYYVQ